MGQLGRTAMRLGERRAKNQSALQSVQSASAATPSSTASASALRPTIVRLIAAAAAAHNRKRLVGSNAARISAQRSWVWLASA